ncbi:hypothetical protein Tco_0211370 [Tanacetum coccineum]
MAAFIQPNAPHWLVGLSVVKHAAAMERQRLAVAVMAGGGDYVGEGDEGGGIGGERLSRGSAMVRQRRVGCRRAGLRVAWSELVDRGDRDGSSFLVLAENPVGKDFLGGVEVAGRGGV